MVSEIDSSNTVLALCLAPYLSQMDWTEPHGFHELRNHPHALQNAETEMEIGRLDDQHDV